MFPVFYARAQIRDCGILCSALFSFFIATMTAVWWNTRKCLAYCEIVACILYTHVSTEGYCTKEKLQFKCSPFFGQISGVS